MAITGSQKAYRYALSNVARSGATRSGYVSGHVFITIGGTPVIPPSGTDPSTRIGIVLDSLTITDSLDEVPNRCTFRVTNSVPLTGQEIIIRLGSTNNAARLFAGHILTVDEVLGGKDTQIRADVSCVDYTWEFGFAMVTQRYAFMSASVIASDLITTYAGANGFSPVLPAALLPALEEITYTNEDLANALTRLARRIGGYWYVDYQKGVHLFIDPEPGQAPLPLTISHPTLAIAGFAHSLDRSQVLTRVYVEGRGSTLLSDVRIGDTILPLAAVDMFQALPDVFLKASFQGAEGGAQHLSFADVVPGGLGTIIGPGIAPSGPLTVALAAGSGIDVGAHAYAYTWTTAAGETKPSPFASVTHIAGAATPTLATTAVNDPTTAVNEANYPGNGAWRIGDTVEWAYSWAQTDQVATGTPLSPLRALVAVKSQYWYNSPGHSPQGMLVDIVYSPDPSVKFVFVWHRVNGGTWRFWGTASGTSGWTNYPGSTPYRASFTTPETYSFVATPPVSATPLQRSTISGIAVGPATVTGRKVYRTAAGGSQLKLWATIPENVSTTGVDATPDASLGANAPAADTSGLPQPVGQVLPGDVTIMVSTTAPFRAAGGWAIIGNGDQVIRYTGISGNTITGIPPSGIGAIVAAVSYGSTITAAALLTGLPASGARAIRTRNLTAGDEIYLVVQCDDGAAQAQLAAAVGGTGIREEWVQDRRLSIGEARARGQATLQLRPLDQATLSYTCRDGQTASGKTVQVDLTPAAGSPVNVSGAFKIQQVTIDNFRGRPEQPPTYTVQASSTRFSFEDWLRKLRTKD